MDDVAKAALMQRASEAILTAIEASGAGNNAEVIFAALGSVCGCMAVATGEPEKALATMNAVAAGVVSGALLDG